MESAEIKLTCAWFFFWGGGQWKLTFIFNSSFLKQQQSLGKWTHQLNTSFCLFSLTMEGLMGCLFRAHFCRCILCENKWVATWAFASLLYQGPSDINQYRLVLLGIDGAFQIIESFSIFQNNHSHFSEKKKKPHFESLGVLGDQVLLGCCLPNLAHWLLGHVVSLQPVHGPKSQFVDVNVYTFRCWISWVGPSSKNLPGNDPINQWVRKLWADPASGM